MSDIILASGTWQSRMIWLPTWRTLTWAPGNAWLTRVSSSFESTVTRTRKETGRLRLSQRVRLVVPNDLPVMFRNRDSGSSTSNSTSATCGLATTTRVSIRLVWMTLHSPATRAISASGSWIFTIRLDTSEATSVDAEFAG